MELIQSIFDQFHAPESMLEITRIREERDHIVEALKVRNLTPEQLAVVDQLLDADQQRRQAQQQLDQTRYEANQLDAQLGGIYQEGQREEAKAIKQSATALKTTEKDLNEAFAQADAQMNTLLLAIPNIPHPSVPPGNTDEDNEVEKDWSEALPELHEGALPHWDLGKKLNLLDFDLGVKITGAGFPVFRGKGARLQRALIQFFLDEAGAAGYEEIVPPLLVNEATARGTGQLPDKEGQMYYVEKDDLYLIPTAEVPVTNILRGEILDEKDFPIKFTGYTPCFRREAGAYGADVRGLNRVHQFDKVEIVQVTHPDKSYETLQTMVDHVESLMQKLELPYRILRLCGGDLGFTSALTFDFEVYAAAQKRWLEVSSVSNFETFQANRLKLRYRDGDNKIHLAHTLNGSALALARIVAALLENNQDEDGRIHIPKVLHPYTRFEVI